MAPARGEVPVEGEYEVGLLLPVVREELSQPLLYVFLEQLHVGEVAEQSVHT